MKEFEGNCMFFDTSRGKEKFYLIDELNCCEGNLYLMESCKYGDEVPSIIINERGYVKCRNWWGTLEEWIYYQQREVTK